MRNFSVSLIGLMLYSSVALMSDSAIAKQDSNEQLDEKIRAEIINIKNKIKTSPNEIPLRLALIRCLEKQHDYIKVEKELKSLKAIGAPTEYWLKKLLSHYERSYQPKSMIMLYEDIDFESLSKDEKIDIKIFLSSAYIGLGKLSEAATLTNEVLENNPKHVAAYLNQAKCHALSGQLKSAFIAIEKAVEYDNNDDKYLTSQILTVKAELLKHQDKYLEAKNYYESALLAYPTNLLAKIGLTSIYLKNNEEENFIETANQLYEAAPNHPSVMFYKSLVHLNGNDVSKARTLLEKSNNLASNVPATVYALAKIAFGEQQYERTDKLLQQFLSQSPEYMPAIAMSAATKIKLKQPKQAAALLTPFVSEKTKDYRLLALTGSALVMSGQIDQGIHFLKQAALLKPDNASLKTELAMSYLAAGDYIGAQSTLDEVLELDDALMQADVLYIFTAIENKDYESANRVVDQLIKKTPKAPVPYNLKGLIASKLGQKDEAIKWYKKSIKINPNFMSARSNLVDALIASNNLNKAKSVIHEGLKIDSNHAALLFSMAKIGMLQNDKSESLKWLMKAEERNPTQTTPVYKVLNFHLSEGQIFQAISHAVKAEARFTNDIKLKETIAVLYFKNKEYEKSKNYYEVLLSHDKKQSRYYHGLAQALIAEVQFNDAKSVLKQCLDFNPKDNVTLLLLADIAFIEKNYEAARWVSDILLTSDYPALGYRLRGDINMKEENYDAAITAYLSVLKVLPDSETVKNLFLAYAEKNQFHEAFSLLENWLSKYPQDQKMRHFTAAKYLKYQKKQAGQKHYEHLIIDNANDYIALNNLAASYLESDIDKAIKLAKMAYQINPSHPKISDTLGFALIQNDNLEQGIVFIEESLAQADNSETRYHLAVALNKKGDYVGAKKEIETALKSGQTFHSHQKAKALLELLK